MPRRNQINNIPRGGFAVRVGGRKITMKDIERAGRAARKVSKTVKSKGLLKTVKGLAVKGAKAGAAAAVGALAEKAWETVNKELNQRLDSKTNGRTLVDAPSDMTGPASPIAAASVLNTVSKMRLANMSDDRVVHKTNYHTGYPLTSKMKRLLKQNGATYKVLTDSKIDSLGIEARNSLTVNSGFNCKKYHVPPLRSQVICEQVRDLVFANTIGDNMDRYAYNERMSAVAKIKQQFMIKNQSVALPLDLTIHLVKITDTSLINVVDPNFQDFSNFVGRCFTSPSLVPPIPAGRVPEYYVVRNDGVTGVGDERIFEVDCLNQTKLNYSSIFRQGMEVVESFRKVIDPGDFWNFSHTHTTGNGIDMKVLAQTVQPPEQYILTTTQVNNIVLKNKFPFTYGVIFEAKGKLGELYYVPSVGFLNTYLGTTPTAFSYEYKTSAYYVSEPELAGSTTATIPYEYNNTTQSAVPLAAGDGASPVRPFTLTFNNIAGTQISEADPANVGKGYVPVTTSAAPTSRVYEGSAPG